MKRVCLLICLLAALTTASAASAATSGPRRTEIAALEQRVNDLAGQVKTLQKQVKTLQTRNRSLERALIGNFVGDACASALTGDALQQVWSVVDQIASTTQGKTYFGAAAALDDKRACANMRPAIARQAAAPATLVSLQGLITWLVG
jgi:hypothetical protein